MGAKYLSYVKFIATEVLTFFGHVISVLASVDHLAPSLGHLCRFLGSTWDRKLKFSVLKELSWREIIFFKYFVKMQTRRNKQCDFIDKFTPLLMCYLESSVLVGSASLFAPMILQWNLQRMSKSTAGRTEEIMQRFSAACIKIAIVFLYWPAHSKSTRP